MKGRKNITIDQKIINELEKRAEKEGRSFSGMVNFILTMAFFTKDKGGR